ncbi:hypothetical protein GOBAR_AA10215 [Gossypium barbadense]|uniref:N-acyl-L-amino-acid amidohydrolase n=1 Tax=Gossypium barbadense TaxID=3634 RepID=A0A2P5Y498_GOSBA|nr:hypothetical protein GOBAR_AA10215 [Gossypium barbadense]
MEKLCNFYHQFVIVHLLLFSSLLSFTNPTPSPTQDEQSQIISRFQEYLRINTSQPSPNYKKSTQFILSLAESLSLETQVIEFVQGKPLVILKWPGSDLFLPSILLNSHTDVVPSERSKWDYHPFGAHIDENGNIFARGSQDMKCVGMQYMEAVRRLKASGFQPKRSLYLSFVPANTPLIAESLSLETQVIEFVQGKPLVILKWPGSDLFLPSILLNSHTDVVPSERSKWDYHPFGAHIDENGNIFARGSQDMKCVGMQYMEAVRRLKASGFQPKRSLYLSFVPDEEIGGHDGLEKLAQSDVFKNMNVDIVLDEGEPDFTF